MTLHEIDKFYRDRISDVNSEHIKAVKDYLRENGLSEDVINPKGKRGRLRVLREYGSVEIKFYAYTKSGELSKLPSGYIYLWSNNPLGGYKRADKEVEE